MTTTRRLKRIAPLQAGKVLAVLYAGMALIFVPFFGIAALAGAFAGQTQEGGAAVGAIGCGMMLLMAVLVPVAYAIFGFLGGIIGAGLYNLIAGWVGGLEFVVEDVEER